MSARPQPIQKVLRDLRTSLNAGEMSQLRSVPVELTALRALLEWGDPDNSKFGEALVGHNDRGEIVVDFQVPLNWVTFSPDQAVGFAQRLLARVATVKGRADLFLPLTGRKPCENCGQPEGVLLSVSATGYSVGGHTQHKPECPQLRCAHGVLWAGPDDCAACDAERAAAHQDED